MSGVSRRALAVRSLAVLPAKASHRYARPPTPRLRASAPAPDDARGRASIDELGLFVSTLGETGSYERKTAQPRGYRTRGLSTRLRPGLWTPYLKTWGASYPHLGVGFARDEQGARD